MNSAKFLANILENFVYVIVHICPWCTVVIPARAYDPKAVMRAIHEEKCTGMMSGPALFHNILSHCNRQKYDLTSLQYVTLSETTVQATFLGKIERE